MEQKIISILHNISSSKLFNVILILLLNIGGSQLLEDGDIRQTVEYLFSSKVMKLLIIFAICFTATNDFIVSFVCTLITGLIIYELLNKKSNLCIISNTCQKNIEHFSTKKESVYSDKEDTVGSEYYSSNKYKYKLFKEINRK